MQLIFPDYKYYVQLYNVHLSETAENKQYMPAETILANCFYYKFSRRYLLCTHFPVMTQPLPAKTRLPLACKTAWLLPRCCRSLRWSCLASVLSATMTYAEHSRSHRQLFARRLKNLHSCIRNEEIHQSARQFINNANDLFITNLPINPKSLCQKQKYRQLEYPEQETL